MSVVVDAAQRTAKAPMVLVCVYLATLLTALPMAMVMRSSIASHLGHSLAAEQAARGFSSAWLMEYRSQAGDLGQTLRSTVIGFAAVLDNLSAFLDREGRPAPILWLGGAYVVLWLFLAGGVIDRYARNRPTHSYEFFTACGTYFIRFLRLAPFAAITYYVLFRYVHPLLFETVFGAITLNVTAERTAFLYRVMLYVLFLILLAAANLVFDYAKVRAVVEDRRSMAGAIVSAIRFIRRYPASTTTLYLLNGLMFVTVLVLYAAVAPGTGGTPVRIWLGFVVAQLYLAGRLWVRLMFFATETAFFQSRLAHTGYVASPAVARRDPPIVEQVAG